METIYSNVSELSSLLHRTVGTIEALKEDKEHDREVSRELLESNRELSLLLTRGLQEVQIANIEKVVDVEKQLSHEMISRSQEHRRELEEIARTTNQKIEKLSTYFQDIAQKQVNCPARIQYSGRQLYLRNTGVFLSLLLSLIALGLYIKTFLGIKGV